MDNMDVAVREDDNIKKFNIRLYRDYGEGYACNDMSTYEEIVKADDRYIFSFQVEENVEKYRIELYEHACAVKIESALGNGRYALSFETNGIQVCENVYVYADVPEIEFDVKETVIKDICLKYLLEANIPEYYEFVAERAKKNEYNADNDTLEELRNNLREAHEFINMITSSKSWKITEPMRGIKNGIKQRLKTIKICRKIKCAKEALSAQQPLKMNIKSTEEITDILCPKERWQEESNTVFDKNIRFSILVPLYNTPERFLREMIESVRYQTYKNWELCLSDGSDEQHNSVGKICMEYADGDDRIKYRKLDKNLGISENTNVCIDMAEGDYIALFDHDDYLHPSALFENMKVICKYGADYIYTDEATFEGTDIFNIITKHYKPDFAEDNLRANNYICHFSTFKRELLEKTGKFRAEYDGSQDHDLILRLTAHAEKVFHIRKIMYYWRSHENSVASDINAKRYAIDSAKRAVAAHLKSKGINAEIESSRAFPTIFRLKYELMSTPLISIIIPNKDHKMDLKRCVESILKKSTYPNYEIIIVENNSIKAEIFDYYKKLEQYDKIKVITYDGDFNYSKINNWGVKSANGEYLLLLNNDTEVITPEWMEELMMYGQRKDVAVVGAKLYYEDDTIQHAGIVIGLGADRIAGHTHYRVDRNNLGYMGRLFYSQAVSAVTGACMLVKKSIYDELGGLDEEFAVAYNDVDFCLKAREKGYINIFTPYCELYHYESKSRGLENTKLKERRFKSEVQLFREKWKKVIEEGDPYYNPNFSLDRSDFYIPE